MLIDQCMHHDDEYRKLQVQLPAHQGSSRTGHCLGMRARLSNLAQIAMNE